jgi:hypothetical protein
VLAPLAANMMIMLVLCALYLLSCWLYDNAGHPTEHAAFHPTESEFAVFDRMRCFPVKSSALGQSKVWHLQPKRTRLWRLSSPSTSHPRSRRLSLGP